MRQKLRLWSGISGAGVDPRWYAFRRLQSLCITDPNGYPSSASAWMDAALAGAPFSEKHWLAGLCLPFIAGGGTRELVRSMISAASQIKRSRRFVRSTLSLIRPDCYKSCGVSARFIAPMSFINGTHYVGYRTLEASPTEPEWRRWLRDRLCSRLQLQHGAMYDRISSIQAYFLANPSACCLQASRRKCSLCSSRAKRL